MFSVNDTVNYSTTGACKIIDIVKRKVGNNESEYYVLKPCFRQNSTVYVPLDNELLVSKMRKVMTREEAERLISLIPGFNADWIDNDLERNKAFREILHSGNLEEIIKMVRAIYSRKTVLEANSKHLRAADAAVFREAQNIVHSEIAVCLDIEYDDVEQHIKNSLK